MSKFGASLGDALAVFGKTYVHEAQQARNDAEEERWKQFHAKLAESEALRAQAAEKRAVADQTYQEAERLKKTQQDVVESHMTAEMLKQVFGFNVPDAQADAALGTVSKYMNIKQAENSAMEQQIRLKELQQHGDKEAERKRAEDVARRSQLAQSGVPDTLAQTISHLERKQIDAVNTHEDDATYGSIMAKLGPDIAARKAGNEVGLVSDPERSNLGEVLGGTPEGDRMLAWLDTINAKPMRDVTQEDKQFADMVRHDALKAKESMAGGQGNRMLSPELLTKGAMVLGGDEEGQKVLTELHSLARVKDADMTPEQQARADGLINRIAQATDETKPRDAAIQRNEWTLERLHNMDGTPKDPFDGHFPEFVHPEIAQRAAQISNENAKLLGLGGEQGPPASAGQPTSVAQYQQQTGNDRYIAVRQPGKPNSITTLPTDHPQLEEWLRSGKLEVANQADTSKAVGGRPNESTLGQLFSAIAKPFDVTPEMRAKAAASHTGDDIDQLLQSMNTGISAVNSGASWAGGKLSDLNNYLARQIPWPE